MKILRAQKVMEQENIYNKKETESFISRVFKLVFSPAFIKQGIKFVIVGAIGTFVNLSILYILTEIFGLLYLISETIAFTVSVINNYIFNKIYTFEEELKEKLTGKGIKFTLICVVALIVNLFVLFILVEYFYPIFFSNSINLTQFFLLAEIGAICVAFGVNFLGSRFWTFKEKSADSESGNDINRFFIASILSLWLIILGLIDLTYGFLRNDLIFILLGLPLLVASALIIIRLIKINLKRN